jgi:hypothetical protein
MGYLHVSEFRKNSSGTEFHLPNPVKYLHVTVLANTKISNEQVFEILILLEASPF